MPSRPNNTSTPSPPERVVAVAAGENIAADAAIDVQRDQAFQAAGTGDAVIAAQGVDVNVSVEPMSSVNRSKLVRSTRTRLPLGVTTMTSPSVLEPLTCTVSLPAPPSRKSLPSPLLTISRSSPSWPSTTSLPAAADQHVISRPAAQDIHAVAADQQVVAFTAVEIQADQPDQARRCR